MLGRWLADEADQLLFWPLRVRRRRKRSALFHPVCWPERLRWRYDPRVERYTDGIEWIAQVGAERWVVGERMWSGWPDPPAYAFFAFDGRGAVICASDFDDWPPAWSLSVTQRCLARPEAARGGETGDRV